MTKSTRKRTVPGRHTVLKWLRRVVLVSLLVFVGSVCAFLIWRSLARDAVAEATAISEDAGIATMEQVTLGGVDQTVLIRGHDREAEVLLFIHGGPGVPNMPFSHLQSKLEEHFVVVQWDQRGAGKSFSTSLDPTTLEIERYVEDAGELLVWLRERFDKERILLLGHSWGSVVGLKTAARFPDRLHGYIGVAQVTDVMAAQKLVYEETLEKARKRGNREAVDELEKIGAPPFPDPDDHIAACQLLAEFDERPSDFRVHLAVEALRSPHYELSDYVKLYRGAKLSVDRLWEPISEVDLSAEIPNIAVPVVFIQGRNDNLIPGELIESYHRDLIAPTGKSLVWIEDTGHLPHLEKPGLFVDAVLRTVVGLESPSD